MEACVSSLSSPADEKLRIDSAGDGDILGEGPRDKDLLLHLKLASSTTQQ